MRLAGPVAAVWSVNVSPLFLYFGPVDAVHVVGHLLIFVLIAMYLAIFYSLMVIGKQERRCFLCNILRRCFPLVAILLTALDKDDDDNKEESQLVLNLKPKKAGDSTALIPV